MNKLLSIVLSIALFCSPIVYTSAAETPTVDKYLNLEDGTYEDGTVLVTMLSPDDAPLAREGTASFDSQIQIKNSYDFGELSTDNLTDGEKNFLSDKSVKVAQVSSTKYSTEELIDKLDSSAYVLSVEPDYCIQKMSSTNDPLSDSQWALDGGGKFNGTTKGISYSRKPQVNSSDTPVVAIVDTGIDYTNEDIKDNIWVNPYPNQLPGLYGYDFGDNDIDPLDSSEDSHGTHCAGTIAASADNQLGIAGVASNVKLMGLKVFDASEKANTSYVISAFNYIYQAKQLGVNVVAVNCSWGGNNSSTAFKTIVEQLGNAGVLFVFAAGNSAINHDTSSVICPYDLNTSYTVTVGASTANDLPASFSDYGKSTVDLFAPGEKIVSTVGANIFYPALYPEATQQNMTTYTNSGRQDETMLLHPSSIGMSDHSVDYQTIQHSTEDFFDRSDNGSQYIAFRASSITTSSLYLYLDVTDLNLTTSSIYYVSYDYGVKKGSRITWDHSSRARSSNDFVNYKGHVYLRIVGLEGKLGSLEGIYIDNIAISKPNPSLTTFGKYSCMSGTSMAAPFVTGAVALLANAYPSDTVPMRKERLLQCVRAVPALSNYCKTSGILDLSKISSTTAKTTTTASTSTSTKKTSVKVKKVKLNKKKATLKYKKKLKLKATVTPKNATNKKVKWYVSNKKYATVTQKGVVKAKKKGIGHTVKVYAKAKDGSGKKAYCKVKIKKK